MKDSPLVRTSTGTSFEACSATGDAINLDITDAEMQIDPVTILQVRHFANAAVVTDDIIAPMNVDQDYS